MQFKRFGIILAGLLFGTTSHEGRAQSGSATGSVRGRVVNARTHEGVVGARVVIGGSDRAGTSGNDGAYSLNGASAGSHQLIVTRSGFQQKVIAVTITSGETVADIELSPQAVELDPVATVASAGTLTVPSAADARKALQRTPGAVSLVSDVQFKNGPALTIKDVLNYVPGVVTQTRWGPDARVSIRGSGLSRSYGNRGLNAYMDGIPLNTSDGLVEFFEMDPTAYQYVEVYKGANALRYGANSLGGAIVFVSPTGRDASKLEARIDGGSFGQVKTQLSTGGAAGRVDYFVTGSAEQSTGYRAHSKGDAQRMSGNLGLRFTPNVETRFYVNANAWDGHLPGEVSKLSGISTPEAANPVWVAQDQQRNINSARVANKTTFRLGQSATFDVGVHGIYRHVDHPIFQYIDYTVGDFGGFAKLTQESELGSHNNRFTIGVNVLNGKNDETRHVNTGNAIKGALVSSVIDRSKNASGYIENAFAIVPQLEVIVGTQYMHATRARTDRFLTNGNQSGKISFDLWTPKAGLLWNVKQNWQLFGNVSRSAEVPTFDVNTFTSAANSNLKAQTATTFEVGTRGRLPDFTWDVAVYRANLRNELQCLTASTVLGSCNVRNADRTVHQGVEAGMGVALLKSAFADGDRIWLNATYVYNDFRFDGDSVWKNNQLPGVPAHVIKAELLYNGSRGFYFGPSVESMPKAFYADNANTLTADAYTLLNLRAGVDIANRWSAWVEGRNLTDKAYLSTAAIVEAANPTDERFNPGYGRGLFTGVRFKW